MNIIKNTVRDWLKESKHDQVLQLIDEIILEWQINGNKQRRNWWEILAGDKQGKSRVIAGRNIPVLRAAQIRQGVPITVNAIYNETELPIVPIRRAKQKKCELILHSISASIV